MATPSCPPSKIVSGEVLRAEEGSLYPALHRMEEAGWIRAEWITKDTGRRARMYELTAAGKKQLARGRVSLAGGHFGRKSCSEDGLTCHSGRASPMYFAKLIPTARSTKNLHSHIAEAIEQGRDPAEARRAFGPRCAIAKQAATSA